jgi:hypothetical protein
MNAGFKPLFRGSEHLVLTHLRHPSAAELIEKREQALTTDELDERG